MKFSLVFLFGFLVIALCVGLGANELRDGTVVSDGTATDTLGRRFNTVKVTLYDDSAQPWKELVVQQVDFSGKFKLGPVGAHFQCDIGKSLADAAGEIVALDVPMFDSKGRKKDRVFFSVVK
jgi:hypothetical protein